MIKKKPVSKSKFIEIDITGPLGNAFYLLGVAQKLGKQMHLDHEKIMEEMQASDYDNLLKVFDSHFGEVVILYK